MRCFSMFSGVGGFDLACKRQGCEIIGACEIDKYARSVYARHFPGVRIWEDATKIRPEELPDFDILCAGFPCQAFSIAGKRLGFEESRGTLFFEIARIARQKRPGLLLLENVKGLLSHDNGKTFANILATLDELGYDAEWQVLNSKYFVPQNRERIFIIGYLRGEPRPEVFPVREDIEGDNSTRYETQGKGKRVRDQLSGSIQTSPNKGTSTMIAGAIDANYHKGSGTRTMISKPKLKRVKGKPNVYNTDAQAGKIYDPDGISPSVTGQRINSQGWIEEPKIEQLNDPVHSTDRLYSAKGIARTLRANSGGKGSKTGLYEINFERKRVRRLTPLECERLQGFPDGYTEGISDTQRYKCLGNAVTVPVVEFVLGRLLQE